MKAKQLNGIFVSGILLMVILFSGCGGDGEPEAGKKTGTIEPLSVIPVEKTHLEEGDLDGIRKRNEFRILTPRTAESYLPRKGSPLARERELAAACGRSLGLKLVLVLVESFDELIPALLEGKGEIIAANLTVTDSRKKRIAFSLPVAYSQEQVVGRGGEEKMASPADLSGRTVAVEAGTSFLETMEGLKKKYPEITIKIIPGSLSSDEILDRVASGEVDLAVQDSNELEVALSYRSDIVPVLDLTDARPLAWGVRPDSPDLLKAVNSFLKGEALARSREKIYRDDLPGIKKRKTLRMLTTNNATNYFLLRGKLLGFEYELIKHFADAENLQLEVVVAPAYNDLIPWLLEGRGDLIAAFMTIGKEREESGIQFSRPSHYAEEMVVARSDEKKLKTPQDLAGRTVVVRPGSSYRTSLEKLKAEGIDLKIGDAPETMETEEIIEMVARGEYDLTVADTQILAIEESYRDDIKGVFPVSPKTAQGWAARAGDKKLLAAIDAFIKKEYRGVFYNITYKKYFKSPRNVQRAIEEYATVMKDGKISPYDDLIKKYAEKYGFIWKLLAAQMYQESRFNPRAKSWAGAEGLMQVMPKTGKEFGFTGLDDPEIGIHAGVKYMDWVRNRFDEKPDLLNRIWFTLAAYNAGIGHLNDARRLAGQEGWNPLAWFENVEKAMLLLAQPKYSKQARHGYVRGSEPVKYVRSISDRYHAYQALTDDSAGEIELVPDRITESEEIVTGESGDKDIGVEPDSGDKGPSGSSGSSSPPPATVAEASPGRTEHDAEEGKEDFPHTLYTVKKGDTLSRIARKVYGNRTDWKPIYQANRDTLKSPHALKVGQVLKIPERE